MEIDEDELKISRRKKQYEQYQNYLEHVEENATGQMEGKTYKKLQGHSPLTDLFNKQHQHS